MWIVIKNLKSHLFDQQGDKATKAPTSEWLTDALEEELNEEELFFRPI